MFQSLLATLMPLFWAKAAVEESKLHPPPGKRRALPLVGETLAFHDATHDEVTSLVESTGSSSVRLNVITRNVALVTAYEDAFSILNQSWDHKPPVSREKAYKQLMAAFYSPPSLLLEDEDQESASEHRKLWDESIGKALEGNIVQERIVKVVKRWLQRTAGSGSMVDDIYDACKDLGHDLALGTFLSLDSGSMSKDIDGASHDELRQWSEDMLRGQFTLPLG